MKKFWCFLIIALSICSLQLKAHEVVVEKVRTGTFSGVGVMDNGDGYYTTYLTDTDNADSVAVALDVYDKLLQLQGSARINVSKTSQLVASTFTGQFFLLVVADADRKTRTTIILDRAANLFGKKEENNIRAALLTSSGTPSLYAAGMNEVMFIRTASDRKSFEVAVTDAELNERWSKTFGSANKPATVTGVKMEMDRTYIVRKEDREREDRKSVV